jgi:putative membrane protein
MDPAGLDALIASTRCFGGATYAGWTLDLAITGPLALLAALYAAGTARLWRRAGRGHGTRLHEVLLFAAGWTMMAGALVSPLHALSRELFAAHMIEHELMMLAAAPLLVLARPLGPLLWGLPLSWRRGLGGAARLRVIAGLWGALALPLVATALHGAAIWLWHEPRLFAAALRIEWVHWLQHLSFFLSALLFWWVLLGKREVDHGRAMAHLFVTSLHTSLLGILLTFSPRLWYGPMAAADAWGLSSLEDQQLAGLIMWVPGGLAYAGAALVLAAKWIQSSKAA